MESEFVPPELFEAYSEASTLVVDASRGKFPDRWVASVYDHLGFFSVQQGFLTKRSALNFIERTVLEYADEFWRES